MAKTLEQLTQETIGNLHWTILQLRQALEQAQEELAKLKAKDEDSGRV